VAERHCYELVMLWIWGGRGCKGKLKVVNFA